MNYILGIKHIRKMKVRIKGTTRIYDNRKELKDTIGKYDYNKLLSSGLLEFVTDDGEVVELPKQDNEFQGEAPRYNKETKKRVVKVYSSTDDIIF